MTSCSSSFTACSCRVCTGDVGVWSEYGVEGASFEFVLSLEDSKTVIDEAMLIQDSLGPLGTLGSGAIGGSSAHQVPTARLVCGGPSIDHVRDHSVCFSEGDVLAVGTDAVSDNPPRLLAIMLVSTL